MKGSLDAPPIEITGRRWRGIVLAIAAGLFVLLALGATLAGMPADASIFFAILFFGALSAVGVWMAASPARLTLGPEGVTQKVLWRTQSWKWGEVFDFRLATIGLGTRTVGFSFTGERPGGATMRQLNTALAGAEAVLAAGWEVKNEALAELLNGARERWVEGAATPEAGAASAPSTASRSPSPASAGGGGESGRAQNRVLSGLSGARLNRRIYWIAIGGLVALTTVFSFLPGAAFVSLAAMIIAIRLYAARLHDFGWSGWWTAGFFAVLIGGCVIAGVASGLNRDAVLLTSAAIQLVWIGLLGAPPGDAAPNRFGPPPGQPTPAATAESFR